MIQDSSEAYEDSTAIAVIGMACRFPGANTPEEFWRNLVAGVESVTFLPDDILLAAGVDPADLRDPQYVKAAAALDDIESFDANFFGYTPLEAEIMDPQQRLLLEIAWEALEHAGHTPEPRDSPIGVFAGAKTNTYLFHLAANRDLVRSYDFFQLILGGDSALLSTRISYKLNLKGPSYAVQTACSTSLVAVHLACQSLLIRECGMALAGAVALNVPHHVGYMHQEGGILSPDGHCRAFDAQAAGTVFGSGAGMVVLKRLQDAVADGDTIYAVIKGTATNNDGSLKATFTAPSVDGQSDVILEALAYAGVEAETISYIEAHGTGTQLGDPIEVAALTNAFRSATSAQQFCAVGSVKTNVGHLDAAAGMASLIKTVLALYHGQLPATLHFEQPNPNIDFASTPFYVNTELTAWQPPAHAPRRAGVSSFGFGGTNAHAILEEAPPTPRSGPSHPWQLLAISARSAAALEQATDRLASYLRTHPDTNLADAAYTLQLGRTSFAHRRTLVCSTTADASAALEQRDPEQVSSAETTILNRPVIFLFSGQGAQYVGMGRDLYAQEPVFRATVDQCCALLVPHLGCDLRAVLYPAADQDAATNQLTSTALAQPALFVIEYALALLWQSWGVVPQALLGHSIGEYVAATLAGVFTLEDALRLVALRGRLMQALPGGAMLAVACDEPSLRNLLSDQVALAAVNGPRACVASGPHAAIEALEQTLGARGVSTRRLHTSHAFHSPMLDPIQAPFLAELRRVTLQPPTRPYLSNLTGDWISAADATDPAYWVRHLREPVRFADCVRTLAESTEQVWLEVGPGTTLMTLVQQQVEQAVVVASLRHPSDRRAKDDALRTAIGKLWLAGVTIDWAALYSGERRQRIALPTYPFQRERYWLMPTTIPAAVTRPTLAQQKRSDLDSWLYLPTWQRAEQLTDASLASEWLVFVDRDGFGAGLTAQLERRAQVVRVYPGEQFVRESEHSYQIQPANQEHYATLMAELHAAGRLPQHILHTWTVSSGDTADADAITATQQRGFFSLLFLAQALAVHATPIGLTLVASRACAVTAGDQVDPAQRMALGACLTIPQELPHIACRSIDIQIPAASDAREQLSERLLSELAAASVEPLVAYRGIGRWAPSFEAAPPPALAAVPTLRERGVYLIVGGLGGIGLAQAEYLAQQVQARLALVARSELPERGDWDMWLLSHDEDDQTSRRIRSVRALEAHGASVLVLQADVADLTQMRAAIAQTEAHFGAIHGVIHSAGAARGAWFTAITATGLEQCAWHFRPKVWGTLVLAELLRDRPLDFCLLQSSLASVLGGLGNTAYAAANLFLDAFAHAQRRRGLPWVSVNWDSWHNQSDQSQAIGATLAELAITPEEGQRIFARVLALADQPQIVVSTADLQPRLDQWVRRTTWAAASAPSHDRLAVQPLPGRADLERSIAALWQRVLGVTSVGLHDNFFDLGGNSLSGMQLIAELRRELDVQVAPVTLFEAPTVSALARLLQPDDAPPAPAPLAPARRGRDVTETAIAIVGMAGRFPGATTIEQFWHNLQAGVESIQHFSDEELLAAGVPTTLVHDPDYVKARPTLDQVETFDAAFFGYTPREAELMDPQQRLFMECAWEALEHGGYAGATEQHTIGVFGGASISTYLLSLYANPDFATSTDPLATIIGNDKDALTTSVSYKLNLKGPSLAVQTFCSTSLVAVHLACHSLLRGECNLALAGGSSIVVPQQSGYHYQSDGIVSPDGHCRPFDASASGTLFGNGVGIVLLKRLEDALHDGDTIHAVVRGSAINNDGALKVGYTAPSVDGQATVIAEALASAGVSADEISYIEAHGTGTALGDPIEIAALTKAFRAPADHKQWCGIGSVKGNIGHLDRAAGAAALIKTVLALKHRQLPPSLHYTAPNPRIDFDNSPFKVIDTLTPWDSDGRPRRAGVSALGFGGTNAHVVLEEAPASASRAVTGPARTWQLLPLSARTQTALAQASADLAAHLRQHPEAPLSHVAYTLQVGRKAFAERRIVVCRTADEACAALDGGASEHVLSASTTASDRPVVFLFPGQGSQHAGMAQELYQHEPVFRTEIDRCAALLWPDLGLDLRDVLSGSARLGPDQLDQTALTQPALFVVEYALAQLWIGWGIRPQAMLGHSLGEYVAATLAGVFQLEDALRLVALRGRLMQAMPDGAMISVALDEATLTSLLGAELSLAALNAPERCTVSGPPAAVEALAEQLERLDISCRRLPTDRAFHSAHVDLIAAEFAAALEQTRLQPPTIPYLSNVTGQWITPAEATDPRYWLQQMRAPVRFADGIARLAEDTSRVLVEVGPSTTLSSLVRQQASALLVLASLRHHDDPRSDAALITTTLGRLWLAGVTIDWPMLDPQPERRRIPLPTYPFERQRFWLSSRGVVPGTRRPTEVVKLDNLADWFYLPTWQHSPAPTLPTLTQQPRTWLIFSDPYGMGSALAGRLRHADHTAILVAPGQQLRQIDDRVYELNPERPEEYAALLECLRQDDLRPTEIVHLWSLSQEQPSDIADTFDQIQALGFYSVLFLVQALGKDSGLEPLQLTVASNQIASISPTEPPSPAKTTLLGICQVIAQEYPSITCRCVDLLLPARRQTERAADQLLAEALTPSDAIEVAYRGAQRWSRAFEPVRLEAPTDQQPALRSRGVYVITGGLAEIGFALTEYLVGTVQARLVLIEPEPFPPNDAWEHWLATHSDQHSVSRKIRSLQTLIAGGAEISVVNSALTDRDQLEAAVAQAQARFGVIHGAIHAATVVGEQAFRALQETTPTECDWHFTAKARSLFALEAALAGQPLDFCMIVSSLAAFLGGRGYAAYAAANRVMDAFVQRHNQTSEQPWISVNWDAWQIEDGRMTSMSQSLAQLAMTPDQGGAAFQRIVAWQGSDTLVVSTAPLDLRITQLQQQSAALRASLSATDAADLHDAHPRPPLPTPYLAPESDLEQRLAAIWQRVLGFEQIGVHDNFFELGGDSLIAIRVVAQMKQELQVDISVVSLYERLTIKALADYLEQGGDSQVDEAQAEAQEAKINRRKQYRQMKRSSK